MIFDLTDVKRYCDSSGLSAILVGFRMSRQNGTFVLTGVQDHVREIDFYSQLDSILTQLPTVNEAIGFLDLHGRG